MAKTQLRLCNIFWPLLTEDECRLLKSCFLVLSFSSEERHKKRPDVYKGTGDAVTIVSKDMLFDRLVCQLLPAKGEVPESITAKKKTWLTIVVYSLSTRVMSALL